jgi:hypothetical protein
MNRTLGSVTGIEQYGTLVRIWVASPTGDSSDNYIYDMPCLTDDQAKAIANLWREHWAIPSLPIVSAETNDGAKYTVWVDGAIITGFVGNVHDASKLASYWAERGYADVTLMLENADEVYGL